MPPMESSSPRKAAASDPAPKARAGGGPGFAEFVLLIAGMMALVSFSVDNLLPAFAPIREELGVLHANHTQLIVTVFLVGFALMQLVWGPLADSLGRRPVVFAGFALFILGTVIAVQSSGFTELLAGRALQGMGAAAVRVLANTIVRDRFEGREMARVLSLTMMIFVIVPVLAPATGSLILLIGDWRLIFLAMLAMAMTVALWFALRMPETLNPAHRAPLSARAIAGRFLLVARNRETLGYAAAMGMMFACLVGYVVSSPQIFQTDVYPLGPWFPLAFGGVAASMGVAVLGNALLVRRLGMRRLSHGGLVGFMILSALLLAAALMTEGRPPLWLFAPHLALTLCFFTLTMPNFNAMAMAPLGAMAGTAASAIGAATTLAGALFGFAIGGAFDGSVIPLAAGFLLLGGLALAAVIWAERGRLFRPASAEETPEPPPSRRMTAPSRPEA